MTSDGTELDLLYSISTIWTPRDQRYQATLGFEFELCRSSYQQLLHLAVSKIDSQASKWQLTRDEAATAAILSRAFVDHAVGVQKVLRGYVKKEWSQTLTQDFYQQNKSLFDLRNALQHAYDRIDTDPREEITQPLCGDLSWSQITDVPSIDLYWVVFGPMVAEHSASPVIDMADFKRQGLNHIFIRAHGWQIDAVQTFRNVTKLVEEAHGAISRQFDKALVNLGVERGSDRDVRLPSQPSGRLRVEGVSVESFR